ncbi:MAG TPA: EFR1 family ferrodoxin [Synergistaceae bacterium]|nr:EFR1 family ferrodoxin [Synergistaceae bacterium]
MNELDWYYFSGTGNSLYLARRLAASLEGRSISMAEELRKNKVSCETEMLGLAFPLYYGGLPEMVERFAKTVDLSKVRYIVAVVTKGGSPGGLALQQLRKIFERRGAQLNGGFYFLMPANYIALYDAPSEKRQEKLLREAEAKTREVEVAVRARLDYCEKETLLPGLLWRGIYRYWRRKRPRRSRLFEVDSSRCVGCGICVRLCPAGIIRLEEGEPVWEEGCQECMACIQGCPYQAIQRGKKTESRRRYRHPQVTLEDLFVNAPEK